MKVSIIIPVWNGHEHLPACLDAILSQTNPDDEVIVVDNASSDGSSALVRERYPQVCLIENEHNLGFAGGCNVGLQAALREHLVLANQDVTVQEGWLEGMLKALAPPEVGIVGCKLLYPDGTIQHAGGIISYPLGHPNHYGYREPDEGQWDEQREVDYVIGASLGLKRTVLNEIGLFDEGFFPAFYEEVDLCFRARAAGYQVVYTPDAVGIHHETTTVDREGAEYHRWMGRGRLRFVLKHYTAEQFHDDFVPAEQSWLATLAAPAERAGLRMAYLDTLLGLRDVPRTGVLAEEDHEEEVAEALISLREMLSASPEKSSEGTALASDLMAELPWFVQERPFTSTVPIVGPAIARFRELWNSVAAKWYVRPLVEQQNEFNKRLILETARTQGGLAALEEKLVVLHEILACLDRETTAARRLQTEAAYGLQEEVDRLRAHVRVLEEALSGEEDEQ
jgi:GT2 family glycosyltransferase